MIKGFKTYFKQFAISSLIVALVASAYAIDDVVFSDFTTGTTISASEMNAKLNALKESLNSVKFAFKTAEIYSGPGVVSIPPGAPTEIVGVDFACPSDGFVVATYGLDLGISDHLINNADTVQLQIVNDLLGTNGANPGYNQVNVSAQRASGSEFFQVSNVRRFPCQDSVAVHYGVIAQNNLVSPGATAFGAFATLVLQFSPL